MLDRKQEILDVAADLLQTRSFSSFSYQDISDRIGISKASLHHHFASKEDLGVALTERYASQVRSALEDVSRKYRKPWDQFEAYIGMVSGVRQSGNKICAGGVCQAEHNVIPEGMRERIHRAYEFMVNWLVSVLTEGRKQRVMHFPGKPEDQAALIHAAMQGALQNARAEGPKQFTAVVRQLKASLREKA